MMSGKKIVLFVIYLILGVTLLGLGCAGIVDEFWSGMGTALLFIGVLRLIRVVRFHKNEEYREAVETAVNDERNRFLRNKAWAWAGYLFILIAGCSVIVLKVMGQDLLMLAASGAVCLIVVLYWVSYMILRKKY